MLIQIISIELICIRKSCSLNEKCFNFLLIYNYSAFLHHEYLVGCFIALIKIEKVRSTSVQNATSPKFVNSN